MTIAGMRYGQRLKKALEHRGLGQSELARRIGVYPQAIQYLCSEKATGSRYTSAIASELGIRASWLARGEGSMLPVGRSDSGDVIAWETPDDLPDNVFSFIPRLDVRSPGGPGNHVHEDASSFKDQDQAFRKEWLERRGLKIENLACAYCRGHSMEPMISDGSSMLVDLSQTEVEDGKVYVLRYDDELRTKILYKRPGGGLTLSSVNPHYEPISLTAEEAEWVEIVGRVVWSASEH